MALPDPTPGLVIRYDYVWAHDAASGRSQGKDRPACLVAASDSSARPRYVVLLPITHSPPTGETIGIEIPAKVKAFLGLDDEPSWIVVSEHNVDEWPNGGLSAIPGKEGVFSYGFMPPGLFAVVRARFLELAKAKKTVGLKRD